MLYILWIWTKVWWKISSIKILCRIFLLPWKSSVLCWSVFQPLTSTDLFIVYIVFPFPESHIVGIMLCVAFLDWLLSCSHMHLNSLTPADVFSWLESSFLFSAEYIPLFGCTIAHLFIHLWKDSLLVARFWQLWTQLLLISMFDVTLWAQVFTPLVNIKECYCWIMW